jgi:hypothetical protein
LEYNIITQPNSGHEIMMTFKMVPSIARTDATICICFVDGAVVDHLVVLDCMEEGYEYGLIRTSIPERSRGRDDAFFFRKLKADILKIQDLWTSEVGTNLERPHGGGEWRSFLVCREFIDPFATRFFDTTFNVVGAKKTSRP